MRKDAPKEKLRVYNPTEEFRKCAENHTPLTDSSFLRVSRIEGQRI